MVTVSLIEKPISARLACTVSRGTRTDIDFSVYPAETIDLSAYWLVNFYAEYIFHKNLKAFIDLNLHEHVHDAIFYVYSEHVF